ncbi:hypothetical protein SBA5_1010022 [Candidatus Sulfotelmatomonas gaucii]|uniref:Uncharacterized protein n=1 Tax=Candidatus Sulfuritelmatomonas gaucii TaxID=2043161 RepID=A0A2N9L2S9_9BACT|nr:hypothetical protein SBA5_1010022 [Candidatus Sulfotelmatomonas gaucii]
MRALLFVQLYGLEAVKCLESSQMFAQAVRCTRETFAELVTFGAKM